MNVKIFVFRIRIILSLVFLGLQTGAFAQYPVQCTPIVTPPYSPVFTDYSTQSSLFQLQLIQRDIQHEPISVYLKFSLEGNGLSLRSPQNSIPTEQFFLDPGSPVLLAGPDLAATMDVSKLEYTGIDKANFLKTGTTLPDGVYYFKWRAYNALNNAPISNEGFALLSLFKGYPPIINQPYDQAQVKTLDPQLLTIQWTPRSNSTYFNTVYKVQLIELLSPDVSGNMAFQSGYPVFFETLTDQPVYYYSAQDPPLVLGRKYALRVQAMDIEGRDLFENKGYSQVVSFLYGTECLSPQNIQCKPKETKLELTWSSASALYGYRVSYKRIDEKVWQSVETLAPYTTILDLTPQANYQVVVQSLCSNSEESPVKDTLVFKTGTSNNSQTQMVCGAVVAPIDFSEKESLKKLQLDDVIKAYDFEMKVTQIENNAPNDFSGEGVVKINLFGGMPALVRFDHVAINKDYRLTNGTLVLSDGPLIISDEKIKDFQDAYTEIKESVSEELEVTQILLDIEVKSVYYVASEKKIYINDPAGNTQKTLKSGKNYDITDSRGFTWSVSKDGTITEKGFVSKQAIASTNQGSSGVGGASSSQQIKPESPQVFFKAGTSGFGFDSPDLKTGNSNYETLQAAPQNYTVAYASVVVGETLQLKASFQAQGSKIPFDSISFQTKEGHKIPSQANKNAKEWTLSLKGDQENTSEEIYATYQRKDDMQNVISEICGKIIVTSYAWKEQNVVLIPVFGKGESTDSKQIEAELNRIYKQAGVKLRVSKENVWSPSSATSQTVWDVNHGNLTNYSTQQINLIAEWKEKHGTADPNTIYFFIVGKSADPETQGHTPLNRQFGFLFADQGGTTSHVIAHEIGHGYPFALEHTFAGNETEKQTTQNLMDYGSGSLLNYNQWQQIQNPKIKFHLGQEEEEGMVKIISCGKQGKNEKLIPIVQSLATCSFVDDYIAKLTDPELSNFLCAEERKNALKCIAKGFLVGDEDEQSIIRILKTTPLIQKGELIQYLYSEPNLLNDLHNSIDGDELTEYYKELILLFRLSKPETFWVKVKEEFNEKQKYLQKQPISAWAKEKIFYWLDVGIVDYLTTGRIVYENVNITEGNHLVFDQYTSVLSFSIHRTENIDLKAFDIIRIRFISENEQLGVSSGEFLDLPAIGLRFLIQKQFNRDAWLAVNSGFLIGSVGSGNIATLWGGVDCFLGLGAILEDNYRAELSKTAEGKAVLYAWKAMNVAMLVRLGYHVTISLPAAWKNLKVALTNLKAKNPKLATAIEQEADLVFGVSGGGDWIALEEKLISKLSSNIDKNTLNKMIFQMKSSGDEGVKLALRIEKGSLESIEGYTTLIKNASVDNHAIKSVNQALDKADDIIASGKNKSLLRFEDNPSGYDIDLGVKSTTGSNNYTEVYQFKTNTVSLSKNSIQSASSQLYNAPTSKRIVEFRLVEGDNINTIKNNELLKMELKFQLFDKGLKPTNNVVIDEFHFLSTNGEKIKVIYQNGSLQFINF